MMEPKEIEISPLGGSPLNYAVLQGDIEIIKDLVEEGVEVDVKDKKGRTPLHLAAYLGNLKVCELLVEKGADVNAKDNREHTPLHYAVGGIKPYSF